MLVEDDGTEWLEGDSYLEKEMIDLKESWDFREIYGSYFRIDQVWTEVPPCPKKYNKKDLEKIDTKISEINYDLCPQGTLLFL